MKKNIVRIFAVALVAAGFIVTMHPQGNQFSQTAAFGPVSAETMPIPVCPPNDPNACHIEQWGDGQLRVR